MSATTLETDTIRSALHIVQRILQDAWLIEERSVLFSAFQKNFGCSEEQLEAIFLQEFVLF